MTSSRFRCGVVVVALVCATAFAAADVAAQFAMPDPKEMSGIPRPVPVGDLPNRTVSVRLIRGALSNNIANQPVELPIRIVPMARLEMVDLPLLVSTRSTRMLLPLSRESDQSPRTFVPGAVGETAGRTTKVRVCWAGAMTALLAVMGTR